MLGAEWARVTEPKRLQALVQHHLDLTDKPGVALTSLSQLPLKNPPLAPEEGMFTYKGRWYLMMGIDLAEYRSHMRRRSVKWETVSLPVEDFRSLARPIESWL